MAIIFADNMYHIDGFESKKKIFPFGDADAQCFHQEQPRTEVGHFDIFKDESNVQEQGRSNVVCVPQPERRANQFAVFRDETEAMRQVQNGSGSLLDPAQSKLEADWILTVNSQAPDKQRRANGMYEPTKVTDENCLSSYFRDDNSPDVGAAELWGSEIQTFNCEKGLNPQNAPCSNIKITDAAVPPGMLVLPPFSFAYFKLISY
jgi:hypothetical protein